MATVGGRTAVVVAAAQTAPAPEAGYMEPRRLSKTKLVNVKLDADLLWSTCRSVTVGVVLMALGAGMAVGAYFARYVL